MMLQRLLLLLAVLAPLPASAQDEVAVDAVEEEEGAICLLYATRWGGDNAEIRDIERTPVPESYREQFESTAWCKHLVPESLIDWHLPFGTEASATAALAYLERAYMREAPPPNRYAEELERSWRAVSGDLSRARSIEQSEGRSRLMAKSKTIRRFRTLGYDAYGSYRFLAEQHLRIAEEHGSLALLERAQHYLRAAQAGAGFLAELDDREPLEGLFGFNRDTFRTDDLEMRAAVLNAKLARTSEAIAHAETIVQSKERPNYRELGRHAFTGGEDFCDVGRGANARTSLTDECEDDDDAHERVVSYLTARAMLDLIVGDGEPARSNSNVAVALRLLEAELHFDSSRSYGALPANELLLRLRLALADYHRRQYQTLEVDGEIEEALDELRQAEPFARPFEAPRRFERIARDWLDLYRRWEMVQAEDDDEPNPRDARYAVYLEQSLANLDAIARGGD